MSYITFQSIVNIKRILGMSLYWVMCECVCYCAYFINVNKLYVHVCVLERAKHSFFALPKTLSCSAMNKMFKPNTKAENHLQITCFVSTVDIHNYKYQLWKQNRCTADTYMDVHIHKRSSFLILCKCIKLFSLCCCHQRLETFNQ